MCVVQVGIRPGHAKDTIDLAMQVAVASQESAHKKSFPFAETVQNTGKPDRADHRLVGNGNDCHK